MIESIPQLTIEAAPGGAIILRQNGASDILLHPIHVRHLAEKAGLSEPTDPHAQIINSMLVRRLRVLQTRIDHLADWIRNCSDHSHADLSYEVEYAQATSDIAAEFCADLSGAGCQRAHQSEQNAISIAGEGGALEAQSTFVGTPIQKSLI